MKELDWSQQAMCRHSADTCIRAPTECPQGPYNLCCTGTQPAMKTQAIKAKSPDAGVLLMHQTFRAKTACECKRQAFVDFAWGLP